MLSTLICVNSIACFLDFKFTGFLQLGNLLFYLPFFLVGYIFNCYSKRVREFFINKKLILLICSFTVIAVTVFMRFRFNLIYIDSTFPLSFILAFALMYLLYLLANLLPANIKILSLANSYSYQLMLLDGFLKAVLFFAFGEFMSLWMAWIIFLLNFFISLAACSIAKKIPIIKSLIGL